MKRIVIDFFQHRTALTIDGELVEIIMGDPNETKTVGSIYTGLVQNILPSKFAFIDIGLNQNAFIDLNDKKEQSAFAGDKPLKQGQHVIVQVLKDSHDEKGANVSTEISFTGKSVVLYTSAAGDVGVSKRIEDKKERTRLREIAREILPEGYSVILRTSAMGKEADEITTEVKELHIFGETLLEQAQYVKAPAAVYKRSRLHSTLENLLDEEVKEVVINNLAELKNVQRILGELKAPENLAVCNETQALFAYYSIQSQFEKACNKKVWLKSGGFLIIEQTAACAVVDVNTGKFTGAKNQQKVILKTNLEAAVEIAKQIRLRNLSGMIIIDFIDMRDESERCRLQQVLEHELKKDRIGVNLVGMTELGLMQLTRKRMDKPLSEYIDIVCPNCGTVIYSGLTWR